MILDYRAFDTFGESTVLFVAVAAAFEEGLGDLGFTTQELRVLTARPQYEPRFALLEWFYEATGQNDPA